MQQIKEFLLNDYVIIVFELIIMVGLSVIIAKLLKQKKKERIEQELLNKKSKEQEFLDLLNSDRGGNK